MKCKCVCQLPTTVLDNLNDCLINVLHAGHVIRSGCIDEGIADRAQSPHPLEDLLEIEVRQITEISKVPC
jgi:hypothetical protein